MKTTIIDNNIYTFFQPRLSTEQEIVLDDVSFETTGHYRCEVSGDAPMFQTASNEGILYVVGKYMNCKNYNILTLILYL